MDAIEDFKSRIDTFLKRSGLSPSRFGDLACNDPAFVFDLRNGREPKFSTIEKVDNFMVDYVADCEADADEAEAVTPPRPGGTGVFKAAGV